MITDSVVVDARTINDIMTTEDGKYGVLTRENASTRKNGIVILSFEDPAHPKPIAEFTETVTGGVHSTFVYRGYVYLTDDATGSLRVIDIRDPYKPRQVARWQTRPDEAGNFLHDIDVKDGLAYLSYWNRGTGDSRRRQRDEGRQPGEPAAGLAVQVRPELVVSRRRGGRRSRVHPGHPHGLAGREVRLRGRRGVLGPSAPNRGGWRRRAGPGIWPTPCHRCLRSHPPEEVAYYEPRDGGSHNVWVAGDTLYMGDYQGGLGCSTSPASSGEICSARVERSHTWSPATETEPFPTPRTRGGPSTGTV